MKLIDHTIYQHISFGITQLIVPHKGYLDSHANIAANRHVEDGNLFYHTQVHWLSNQGSYTCIYYSGTAPFYVQGYHFLHNDLDKAL